MSGFGLGVITGNSVEQLIKNALTAKDKPEVLERIAQSIQSCNTWMEAMGELIEDVEMIQSVKQVVEFDGNKIPKDFLLKG